LHTQHTSALCFSEHLPRTTSMAVSDTNGVARLPALEGADPQYPVPSTIFENNTAFGKGMYANMGSNEVSEEEFLWMEARRPLCATFESLSVDYSAETAEAMQRNFAEAGLAHLLATLNWPGIGTCWREFLAWCQVAESTDTATPAAALRGFGRSLGRVKTYRALAIDAAALQRILDADCICPSGQLRVGAGILENIVNTKGIRAVGVTCLFIANLRRVLRHDPSISLHDDWQTTSLIASAYASYDKLDPSRSRKVHLFELSCPKVESCGWTLQEVALQSGAVLGGDYSKHEPWFCFPAPAVPQGVWFDGRWQRTERYGLYGVPLLSQRLLRLLVFDSENEIGKAVQPFAARQAELHAGDRHIA